MVLDPAAARLAVPLVLVGAAAVLAYLLARLRPDRRLPAVIGAGLAYAWVDFVNKLLANDISSGRWGLAVVWLAATIGFGALAFLEETTALQRQPAVTVAPVIRAVQDPLPVLMALAGGVEVWGSGAHSVLPLVGGLALVTVGAAVLGRSKAIARVSGDQAPAAGSRHRLGISSGPPRPRWYFAPSDRARCSQPSPPGGADVADRRGHRGRRGCGRRAARCQPGSTTRRPVRAPGTGRSRAVSAQTPATRPRRCCRCRCFTGCGRSRRWREATPLQLVIGAVKARRRRSCSGSIRTGSRAGSWCSRPGRASSRGEVVVGDLLAGQLHLRVGRHAAAGQAHASRSSGIYHTGVTFEDPGAIADAGGRAGARRPHADEVTTIAVG